MKRLIQRVVVAVTATVMGVGGIAAVSPPPAHALASCQQYIGAPSNAPSSVYWSKVGHALDVRHVHDGLVGERVAQRVVHVRGVRQLPVDESRRLQVRHGHHLRHHVVGVVALRVAHQLRVAE